MHSPTKQPVYILIPVHNRKPITLACLKNLHQTGDLQRYHIVVIDDGSTDGTQAAIRDLYPDIELLTGDGHLWWTGAMQQGMQYAYDRGAEFFIWLNDDCQVSPNTLSDLVSFCQANPTAIVGSQGMERDQPTTIAFGGKRKTWQGYRFLQAPSHQVIPCDLLSGNLVCIPRRVVEAIGLPDPKATPHYGGDSLFLLRAQKAGFSLFVDARNAVFNSPGEPRLYPQQWLLGDGEPLRILKLVFIPQSGLSWRVWLRFNWEAYAVWGLVMFAKKYTSIGLITLLRFLPLTLRQTLQAQLHQLSSTLHHLFKPS